MQLSCNKQGLTTVLQGHPTVKGPYLVFVASQLQLLANKNASVGGCRAAVGAIASHFETRDDDVKPAIALDLPFEAIEQVAFKFHDFAAAETGHVNVVALGPALVEMLFALEMHEVQFVDQAVALQQAEGAVHGDAIDLGVDAAGLAQDLAGIEVLAGGFEDAEDSTPLPRHAQPARHEFRLQAPRSLGLRQRHW